MLANSTLDEKASGLARQKILGLAPKPIGKPLDDVLCWPESQELFPRALFPHDEFNARGEDAAGNSVMDRVRQLDLEDAVGAYQRRPKLHQLRGADSKAQQEHGGEGGGSR